MSYAVIRTGGKQYKVTPGELLRVESLTGEIGHDIAFSEVLLTSIEGAVQIGTPLVSGATVTARIVQHGREKKYWCSRKSVEKIIVAVRDIDSILLQFR